VGLESLQDMVCQAMPLFALILGLPRPGLLSRNYFLIEGSLKRVFLPSGILIALLQTFAYCADEHLYAISLCTVLVLVSQYELALKMLYFARSPASRNNAREPVASRLVCVHTLASLCREW
jgi:hypothetical protein